MDVVLLVCRNYTKPAGQNAPVPVGERVSWSGDSVVWETKYI